MQKIIKILEFNKNKRSISNELPVTHAAVFDWD